MHKLTTIAIAAALGIAWTAFPAGAAGTAPKEDKTVKEKAVDAKDTVKEKTSEAWDKTKEKTSEAWDKTKEKTVEGKDKVKAADGKPAAVVGTRMSALPPQPRSGPASEAHGYRCAVLAPVADERRISFCTRQLDVSAT